MAPRPPGTPGRDEGYLYWLGWLGHVGNSTFSSQDAHGVYRHVYVVATCNTLKSILATQPARPRGHRIRPAAGDDVPAMTRMNGESD